LRRQTKRNFRKPLIVMTPKSLLRLPACVSPVDEFVSGRFREILDDSSADPARVRRVVLCSGKVFYELAECRKEGKANEVAIVRVEQFYPLHEELLKQVLGRYNRAKQFVWVQEESQNMGGWSFMEPRLRALGFPVEYVGRDASASPATGSLTVHKQEQKELVEAAIHGPYPHLVRAGSKVQIAANGDGNGSAHERPAVAAAK
jgi:2-oxoglutarate dehydrogenase E1 component